MTGDRTLVDIFEFTKGSGIQPSNQRGFGVMRSTDTGQSWSRVRLRFPDSVRSALDFCRSSRYAPGGSRRNARVIRLDDRAGKGRRKGV